MTVLEGAARLGLTDSADLPANRGVYMHDRPGAWLRYFGVARIGVLSFLACGAAFMQIERYGPALLVLYMAGFVCSLWYLHVVERFNRVHPVQCWIQLLVDFGVVATTVALTQGISSFFTFMFVVVVLEAGLLLGLMQGFVLASLAMLFMLGQIVAAPGGVHAIGEFEIAYNFLVQSLAFYLTAFISGYWNQRIHLLQEFQREILDNMNSGFLITDQRGRIVLQNTAATQILGRTPEHSVGESVGNVLRLSSGAECPVVTALRSGRDFTSYEFEASRTDGSEVLLGLTTNCMREKDGEISGVIASFSDLTEISAMREELRKQDRLAVVGELATGLAHEIRNPVAVIRGALEELAHASGNPALEEKLRRMSIRESDHLNEIVGGFLDFAREPSRKRERLDVRALVKEVAELIRREYDAGNDLVVRVCLPDTPAWVSCDASQLKQVFVNLAKNAVEAMDCVGTLDISVEPGGGPVEIRFDDEGTGIDPQKIGRIFEPFFTTKETGVGMGLAVCMRIITAHDGTLRAAVRKQGGCSMSIALPSAGNEQE